MRYFVFLGLFATSNLWSVVDVANYRQSSVDLKHKIAKVTTFSSQAQISRTARLKTNKNKTWVRFSHLPYKMDKESLKVNLKNERGKISQIIIEDSFEYVGLNPKIKKQYTNLKSLYAKRLDLKQQRILKNQHYDFVSSLKFTTPFQKNNQHYTPFQAPINKINSAMNQVQKKSETLFNEVKELDSRLRELAEKISILERKLSTITSTKSQNWVTHVYVLVEQLKTKTSSTFELSYLISNAHWFPVYDLRTQLDPKRGVARINLVTAGKIEQHTGEDWNEVDIILSTLDPIPLYLPKLKKWVFQEVREEAPIQQASQNRAGYSFLGKPQAKDISAPRRQRMAPKMESQKKASGLSRPMKKKEIVSEAKKSYGQKVSEPTNLFPLIELDEMFSSLKVLKNQFSQMESGGEVKAYQYTEKHIKQNSYRNNLLPAVQAKGRVIKFKSPLKISLKNDEDPLKIPVGSQWLEGKLSYLSIPKKDKKVYLRAKTENTLKHPILAGQAQVFMDGGLVSKTQLSTLSEGSHFTIDLGVDKNVRTQRVVKKESIEKGILFKDHATKVTVEIEIVNHHSYAIDLELHDHYPRSPADEIKIKRESVNPEPSFESKYRVMRWDLKIPAKGKQKVSFIYLVSHPENTILSELN